jgi:hypothetical protein
MRSSMGASFSSVVDVVGARLLHLAFDRHRPGAGLQRVRVARRVGLVGAELVEVVVGGGVRRRRGLSITSGARHAAARTRQRRQGGGLACASASRPAQAGQRRPRRAGRRRRSQVARPSYTARGVISDGRRWSKPRGRVSGSAWSDLQVCRHWRPSCPEPYIPANGHALRRVTAQVDPRALPRDTLGAPSHYRCRRSAARTGTCSRPGRRRWSPPGRTSAHQADTAPRRPFISRMCSQAA